MMNLFVIVLKIISFAFALTGVFLTISWDYPVYYKFFHLPSFMLITTGLVGMLFALNHFKDVFYLFGTIISKSDTKVWNKIKYADEKMEEITKDLYEVGVASLQQHINDPKLPNSWRATLSQIEAKVDPEDILMLLKRQSFKFEHDIQNKMDILSELTVLAPSLGMFGTILGLIKLLSNLEMREMLSQNMALALVTTLYGIFFANMILNPLKTRMDRYRLSVLKGYEQIDFWLNIIKNKKPVFYISQDFTKGSESEEKES